jgi:lysophospholipase L1-like esterase
MKLSTCAALAALAASTATSPSETVDIGGLSQQSLLATGNTTRIQQAFARARRGGTVTVAVIGGSITAGATASVPTKRYGNLVAAWWRQTFPKADIKFINAGIGATGSDYGTLRAKRDLLVHRPDFVVVEYGVNDANARDAAETLEGLLRQILKQPNQPAALLLFMMHQGGGNAQEWHGKVGAHYGLPMVSYRDALWPEIKADRLKWGDVMADEVHPNDLGHECAARFITNLLEHVSREPATIKPLPPPLFTDCYEHVTLLEAGDLKPVKNEGWLFDADSQSWRSDKPASVLEFEISGRVLYSMHFVIKKAMGKVKMQVDDAPPVLRDGWFNQTWGGYRSTQMLAKDLKSGPHRVRIELLTEKNPGSDGHEFRLLGLGAAGVDAE